MVYLAGMPFAEFLYESKQENLHSLLTDIMKQLDNFRIDINNGNLQKASSYLLLFKILLPNILVKLLWISKKKIIFLYPKTNNFLNIPKAPGLTPEGFHTVSY